MLRCSVGRLVIRLSSIVYLGMRYPGSKVQSSELARVFTPLPAPVRSGADSARRPRPRSAARSRRSRAAMASPAVVAVDQRGHYPSAMGRSLLDKVWELHTVRRSIRGQTQLFIGLHLIHEVTSPQAFAMLRERGLSVPFPERTFATVDHIIPTDSQAAAARRRTGRGDDARARAELPRARHPLLRPETRPPGHRARDRAGARAHAARDDDRLRRQPHQHARRLRRGRVRDRHEPGARRARDASAWRSSARRSAASRSTASSRPGVYAKDVILHIIRKLGVKGGVGYAYEYAGAGLRRDVDGRADDGLQHVDRGRRAARLRESRRDDRRVPPRPARSRRAARRSSARRAGGGRSRRTRTPPTTTS